MKIYKQENIYTDATYKQILVKITSHGAGLETNTHLLPGKRIWYIFDK